MSAEQIAGVCLLVAFLSFVFYVAWNSRQNEKKQQGTDVQPPQGEYEEKATVGEERKDAGKGKRRS